MGDDHRIIGQPVRRLDAFEKVTGTIRYGIDLSVADMLYARTKRSPFPHARLLSIDANQAATLSGVEVSPIASPRSLIPRTLLAAIHKRKIAGPPLRSRCDSPVAGEKPAPCPGLLMTLDVGNNIADSTDLFRVLV